MTNATGIAAPAGQLRFRREREDDRAFRFHLFSASRLPEFQAARIGPALAEQLLQLQFAAQAAGYVAQFPDAQHDIIDLDREPVGRIVVDRPPGMLHVVDLAILPHWRNRGCGTAVLQAIIDEARQAGIPVRLKVSSTNDLALRLYLRLGFVPIAELALVILLEWRSPLMA